MQINVSGHHLDVTDSLRHYVITKLDKLERHFDKITHMNVILTVEKLRQKPNRPSIFPAAKSTQTPSLMICTPPSTS